MERHHRSGQGQALLLRINGRIGLSSQGSRITWRGEYDGKPFEDEGEVIEAVPHERLRVTHFSSLTGEPDRPENYHELVFKLDHAGAVTHVTFTQDNNASADEAEHASESWDAMLHGLKELVERG